MMNGNSIRKRHYVNPESERGLVLFFALIALVAMMLAAVALIRSVDTNTSVAGNLAFKQSATISADSGVETAMLLLTNPALDTTVNSAANAALGYYATSSERQLTTATFTWDNTNSALATGTNIVAGKDASGNTIRFVVERMCSTTGVPIEDTCLFGQGKEGGGSLNDDDYDPGPPSPPAFSPIYRVTARVEGPKNTVSYIQAYLY